MGSNAIQRIYDIRHADHTFTKYHYQKSDSLPVSKNDVRIHSYAFGETEKEAIINDANLVDSQLPEYTLVKFDTYKMTTDCKTIWICDATIDIKISTIPSDTDTQAKKNLKQQL